MNKKINISIFGGGRIGYVHAKYLAHNLNAKVKSLVDPYMNDDIKNKFQALNVQEFLLDFNDALNDKEVDAVYICTPTNTHFDLCKKALLANKHVFCEKPVSLNLAEISELKKLLAKTNLVFCVGHNRRFDHNFLAIKNTIKEKTIGDLLQIKISSRDPNLPPIAYLKTSGGLFCDMMIHDLDMALFLSQKKVVSVYAHGGVFFDEKVKTEAHDVDTAVVTLVFEDNSMAVIDNCRVATYGYDQRVEVHGTLGSANISNDANSTLCVSTNAGVNYEKPLYFFLERYAKAYESESMAFVDAILNNKPAPVSIDDGYNAVLIAQAATLSCQEKRVVYLKEFEN